MGKLTANFSLEEFSVSAQHPDLVVPVPESLVPKAKALASNVLQPIRDEIQRPMRIVSAYRSKALNRAVKGSVTSQHVRMEAADFTASNLRAVWLQILQMASEGRLAGAGQMIYYPAKGFIHVAVPSGRYQGPTCCVHWPEQGHLYAVITPSFAAFNALVPANLDPQRDQVRFA
jgi:DNA-binding transcriptional regulator YdaS (Cro superfamily)